jgi:hypothetical protein
MSYNGSGTFNINSAGQPVVTGTTITSTAFNLLTADLATGLSTAMTKDGQSTPTANIPMGTFKLTGLGAGTAATDAAQYGQLQAGATTIAVVTGTDTLTGTLTPAITAYATGNLFSFVAANTNTGAATIALNGLAAKNITKTGSTALAAGDIVSGRVYLIEYDGTRFQLLNPSASTVASFSAGSTGFTPSSATTGAVTLAGTLATTNGGTGLTSFTSGGVVYASSTSALATGSALTFDGTYFNANGLRISGSDSSNTIYKASGDFGLTTNTGALTYQTTANQPQVFYINSSEAMRLTSTGLGIGTSTVSVALEVARSGNAYGLFRGGSASVGNGLTVGQNSAGDGLFYNGLSTGNLLFGTAGTTRATIDSSGNLGLGVTPSAWNSAIKAYEVKAAGNSLSSSAATNIYVTNNAVLGSGGFVYGATAPASYFAQGSGAYYWYQAASGTAGNAITFTQALTLDSSGSLLIGDTSAPSNGINTAALSTKGQGTSGSRRATASAMGITASLATLATANTYSFGGFGGYGLFVAEGGDPNAAWRAAAIVWSTGAALTILNLGSSNITVGSSGTTITVQNTSASAQTIAWSMLVLG